MNNLPAKVENANTNLTTPSHWTREQIELLKDTICKGATDSELQMFIFQCKRTNLDPFTRQAFAVKRWDSSLQKDTMSFQVSVDGLRLIADRTGKYVGQTSPLWCGADGVWRDVWIKPEPPLAAKVGIYRSDFKDAIWGVATLRAYMQIKKGGAPNTFWEKMPDVMLAKCAESIALRKAFPHEMSGIYTQEEMVEHHENNGGNGNGNGHQTKSPSEKQTMPAVTPEELEKKLREDLAWTKDKINLVSSQDFTWEELACGDFPVERIKDGKKTEVGGRQYLQQLAAWKERPEIAIKAKIALEMKKIEATPEQDPKPNSPQDIGGNGYEKQPQKA